MRGRVAKHGQSLVRVGLDHLDSARVLDRGVEVDDPAVQLGGDPLLEALLVLGHEEGVEGGAGLGLEGAAVQFKLQHSGCRSLWIGEEMVGDIGLEPLTPCMSSRNYNQLS